MVPVDPGRGRPEWIVQAIERTTFLDLPTDLAGEVHLYVGWRDLGEMLARVVRVGPRPEYSWSTAPRAPCPP